MASGGDPPMPNLDKVLEDEKPEIPSLSTSSSSSLSSAFTINHDDPGTADPNSLGPLRNERAAMREDGTGDGVHPVLGRPNHTSAWTAVSLRAHGLELDPDAERKLRTADDGSNKPMDHPLNPLATQFVYALDDVVQETKELVGEGEDSTLKLHYHIPACPGPSGPDDCWNDVNPRLFRGKSEASAPLGLLVAVEGIPGSGKTTILEALGTSRNITICPGSGFEGNPGVWKSTFLGLHNPWVNFVQDPYKNCEAYLRWRGEMVRESCAQRPMKEGALFMEESVLPDYKAMAALKMGYMTEFSVLNHLSMEKKSAYHTDHPDYVIVLRTDPEVAFERLQKRELPGDYMVSREFLVACANSLRNWITELPNNYLPRVFVVENNVDLMFIKDVVSEIHGLYPYMKERRLGITGNPGCVYLSAPEDPQRRRENEDTTRHVLARIKEGAWLLKPWCRDCFLPSYVSRENYTRWPAMRGVGTKPLSQMTRPPRPPPFDLA